MPTGYTASVADGTVTDLKTFAMRLARGMGALIDMRDAPWDAPLPEKLEPSPYYASQIARLNIEIAALNAMTPEQLDAEAQKGAAKFDADSAEARQRHEDIRDRYRAMVEKVKAWDGAPEGIKEFALSQLSESLSFDCREPFHYWGSRPPESGVYWLKQQKELLLNELDHMVKSKAEDDARYEARNAWLVQLHRSLSSLPEGVISEVTNG